MSSAAWALFLLCHGLALALQQPKVAIWSQRDASKFSQQQRKLEERRAVLRGLQAQAQEAEAQVAEQERLKASLQAQTDGAHMTKAHSSSRIDEFVADTAAMRKSVNVTQHYFPNLQPLLDKVVEDNFYAYSALKEISDVHAQTMTALEHLTSLNKHLLGKDVRAFETPSGPEAASASRGAKPWGQAQEGAKVPGPAKGLFDPLERQGLPPRFQGWPAKPWAPESEAWPRKKAAAADRAWRP